MPALPPPTSPLPELPPLPATPTAAVPAAAAPPARRPLSRRTQTLDNYALAAASPFSVAGAPSMLFTADGAEDGTGCTASVGALPIPRAAHPGAENAMQVDYPSPVDGGAFEWARPQAHAQRV